MFLSKTVTFCRIGTNLQMPVKDTCRKGWNVDLVKIII